MILIFLHCLLMSCVITCKDGGRIAGALSPYAGVVGLGLGGMIAYSGMVLNPIFYLILLSGGYETFQRFYNPNHMPPNYYKVRSLARSCGCSIVEVEAETFV